MKKILISIGLALVLWGMLGSAALAAAPSVVHLSPLPDVNADQGRIKIILSIVFTVIGALSLLMFTVGGLRYIASQGDPQATAKAKGTLIYSLVGMVVAISAVAIVTFIIGRV